MQFIELQQFGWNLVTFGFVGAMSTALLGFWGIIQQARTIWRQRSGESVPMLMHTYGLLFFGGGSVYGFQIGSLALIIMGLRGLLTLPVLYGLWKFSNFRWWEWLGTAIVLTILILMPFLPYLDEIYFLTSLGMVPFFLPQPIAILRNGRGAVSLGFLLSAFIGIAFWTVYSFAIGNWVLMITNPIMLTVVTATIILWLLKPAPAAPAQA
jgi:uncharacterized protein with PQ loop repeat